MSFISTNQPFFFIFRWIKLLFYKADKDKSRALNFEECCQILLLLNLKLDPEAAKCDIAGLSVVTKYSTLKHKQTKDFQFYCIG